MRRAGFRLGRRAARRGSFVHLGGVEEFSCGRVDAPAVDEHPGVVAVPSGVIVIGGGGEEITWVAGVVCGCGAVVECASAPPPFRGAHWRTHRATVPLSGGAVVAHWRTGALTCGFSVPLRWRGGGALVVIFVFKMIFTGSQWRTESAGQRVSAPLILKRWRSRGALTGTLRRTRRGAGDPMQTALARPLYDRQHTPPDGDLERLTDPVTTVLLAQGLLDLPHRPPGFECEIFDDRLNCFVVFMVGPRPTLECQVTRGRVENKTRFRHVHITAISGEIP